LRLVTQVILWVSIIALGWLIIAKLTSTLHP